MLRKIGNYNSTDKQLTRFRYGIVVIFRKSVAQRFAFFPKQQRDLGKVAASTFARWFVLPSSGGLIEVLSCVCPSSLVIRAALDFTHAHTRPTGGFSPNQIVRKFYKEASRLCLFTRRRF